MFIIMIHVCAYVCGIPCLCCRYASADKRSKLPQWVTQFLPDAHINLTTDMAVHVSNGALYCVVFVLSRRFIHCECTSHVSLIYTRCWSPLSSVTRSNMPRRTLLPCVR